MLSLIVAVHDVQPWIRECLQSVVDHAPEGTEVIVVDDGSTDDSGRICDDMASGRPLWRVIHQPNAGLGAARNTGLRAATGDLVGYLDGDDTLLPAYGDLVRLAARHGYAVATGAVLRTDGSRAWASGLHERALKPLGDAAVIATDHSLIFDTTAWNKVYRRDFVLEHELFFPEGVLYEDLPVTIPAMHLAGRVGCLHAPVYAWRTREVGLSITQRRHEISNLRDRFAAVSAVDRFLEQHRLHPLRLAHDEKVLRLDLPLYTSALPEADREYREEYLRFCAHLLANTPQDRRRALPPTLRLYVELADAGRMDDLVRAVAARRGVRAWAADDCSRWTKVRQDLAIYPLEHELGLASWRQIARRAPVRTVKLLLPASTRRQLGALRRRVKGLRAAPSRARAVPSDASNGHDRADGSGTLPSEASSQRQATNP